MSDELLGVQQDTGEEGVNLTLETDRFRSEEVALVLLEILSDADRFPEEMKKVSRKMAQLLGRVDPLDPYQTIEPFQLKADTEGILEESRYECDLDFMLHRLVIPTDFWHKMNYRGEAWPQLVAFVRQAIITNYGGYKRERAEPLVEIFTNAVEEEELLAMLREHPRVDFLEE